jgi:hypothetical protein
MTVLLVTIALGCGDSAISHGEPLAQDETAAAGKNQDGGALASASPAPPTAVLTNRYDNGRTGATYAESVLSATNLPSGNFRLLFSRAVDGIVQAQPLYFPGLSVNGAVHNVVYVATEHNSVYAFDADAPAAIAPLWARSLGPSAPANKAVFGCADLFPEVGITSTPVIEPVTGILYVVAKTLEGGAYHHWIHALDIATGADRIAPAEITASVRGTGAGSAGGTLTFEPTKHLNRAGLLLDRGTLYVAFGSHCDRKPTHGWIMAYSPSTLAQGAVFSNTPNGVFGGIWQAGIGLSADDSGVYFAGGNGDFDPSGNGAALGQSVARLSPTLKVMDWWTPSQAATMNRTDSDLSTGAVLGTGTDLVFVGSKAAQLYVLNRTNLGRFHAGGDQILQTLPLSGHLHGGPVFWKGPSGTSLFLWAEGGPLKAYHVGANGLDVTPSSTNAMASPGHPGGIITVSSSGASAGTGIVWATLGPVGDAWHGLAPGVLAAFDASDVSRLLWSSHQNAARDGLGLFAKFCPPTVANGRVYVGTASKALRVYGTR